MIRDEQVANVGEQVAERAVKDHHSNFAPVLDSETSNPCVQ